MNKKTAFFLLLICGLSLFINLYKKDVSPPCFNTDEAAFGYNAYSLLKTGKDEYGNLLPLRLKSFGDYKMPLYSYLSIPFVAIGGLSENSTRALNSLVALVFPIIIFLFTQELFNKRKISLIAALLFSLTPGTQTIGRQAHEAYLTTFFILLSLWLFLKMINKSSPVIKLFFFLSLIPLSFGYQFSRLWLVLFFILIFYCTLKKISSIKFLIAYFFILILLLIPDVIVKPARVGNLFFLNNAGLGLQIAELRSEGSSRLLYNKATIGLKNFISEHFNSYSFQFLVTKGEENKRFTYSGGFSTITLIEYIFLFIGLYFLFKNKQKLRFLLVYFLATAPLAASISWAGASITRSLPLIIFINIVCAYGFISLINDSYDKNISGLAASIVVAGYLIFCFYSWDFYFNHYPKRSATIRAWQCGNKELADYVKNNYRKTDNFYITKKNGQSYIFMLFYLLYPPEKYQKQAKLSEPDEFGFGQVEKFDKFNFNFFYDPNLRNTILIGYPDDYNLIGLDPNKIKKIKVGSEEIFWIYEKNQANK